MKPDDESPGGPLRAARRTLEPREHGILLILWVLSLTGALVLWPDGPAWAGTVGRVGLVAFFALLAWWALTGFSGYEHHTGLRIVRRPRPARSSWMPAVLALAGCVGGLLALYFGIKSAAVVIATAGCATAAMVLLLVRRFAVFASLSIVGIAIGVAALIVVQSVATGFQHEFERRVLGVYAHINVTRAFGISEYRRFETYLRGVDGVVGASPFVYYAMALAPSPRTGEEAELRRATVLVKGIEPATAHEVIDLEDHLRASGRPPVSISALSSDLELQPLPDRSDDKLPAVIAATPDPRGEGWYADALAHWRALPDAEKYGHGRHTEFEFDDGDPWPDAEPTTVVAPGGAQDGDLPTMFVGVTLARELSLEVDDIVTLVDPGAGFDHAEAPEFRRYRIAGVFRAGFQEYDSRLIYVHIRELQWFKYRGKDTVSGVDLRLADPYEAPVVEQELRRTIGDDEYSILEWQKLNANLFQSIRTQKSILTIILSLVSTVAGFNVLAALWTMVVRRTAEIAIMMSMGASEGGVARIFQFAGMTLGAVGAVAGVAFGLVLCALVEFYGYSLDPEVYFIERLPVEISLVQIAGVLSLTMAISFFATVPPSLRAAQLRPVEGLRGE
ncbi:MAG: ABC transporter permease [Deltaproteobacteria bacterium]|nr:ABC transporter permease [Deltaproteobacteria bacterium]MBK8238163.1 ABC transporter permease [Deltaproteobacteria bacterium]MBK8718492.1 ABC transporter permease [Deltaproteobacteria bacterium]MBP7288555.1 ABC transporter permease [Nannocystaceae bacterium]